MFMLNPVMLPNGFDFQTIIMGALCLGAAWALYRCLKDFFKNDMKGMF